jgi:probable selenate reductase molybdenum-binding subunit
MIETKIVGKSIRKVDGLSHSTGRSLFTDDIYLPGMLHGKILSSPHSHARIKHIDTSKAFSLEGVREVLTCSNVPHIAYTTAGQGYPEPSPYDTFILDNKVRFAGDRVAAVAADTEEIAEKALSLIEVEYEILPAIYDVREASKDGSVIIHDEEEAHVILPLVYEPKKNFVAQVDFKLGDIEKGFKEADFIIEKTYYAHRAQHCATELHIAITYLDEKDRLVVRTSTQVPFHVRRILAHCLGIPLRKIRVLKPRVGGAFGGKQEVITEDICALLTLRTGKPVRLQYSREEVFVMARTRHPHYNYLKTGVKKDGTITAVDMKIISDTGAYGGHALTVMSNAGSKVLPIYNKCKHINFDGRAYYTNLPVAGAYRGYGATQGAMAMEIQMDEMACAIGMDPVEFRKKNLIKSGETSPVFRALGEGGEGVDQTIRSCGIFECMELGAKEIGWYEKKDIHDTDKAHIKRGVGMVCLMQGSSIPKIDMGSASMKMNDDGSFNLLTGATDVGTGSDTLLSQIAAEVLSVTVDDIIIYSSDTDITPFDVGAYASSTTYLSGEAVRKTAEAVKEQIMSVAGKMLKEDIKDLICRDKKVISLKTGKEVVYSNIALQSLYISDQFQIGHMASHVAQESPPPFSAHFTEVEVDTDTGYVRVVKYVAAVDCGTAVNPPLAHGQTAGGVLNGISYALTEEYNFDKSGKMLNSNLGDYKVFSMADLPNIVTILVPTCEPTGPYGAKSVSEIPMNGPMPAISNAIYNATGVRLTEGPFTPEKVLKALGKI